MNLDHWLSYLETLHPKPIDLGLERVYEVAKQLNLFPLNTFVITVAGTNGKGSCVALLEKILLTAHYRVGTYTSPHLLKYNERTRVKRLIWIVLFWKWAWVDV
jgi:dihydrofolate synthase / folylpolyglutamate synthase